MLKESKRPIVMGGRGSSKEEKIYTTNAKKPCMRMRMFVCFKWKLRVEPFNCGYSWFVWSHCKGRKGHNRRNLRKKKGGPSQQFYRPGAGFVKLDIISSLTFVALSFTLERGEMAFRGDLCAPWPWGQVRWPQSRGAISPHLVCVLWKSQLFYITSVCKCKISIPKSTIITLQYRFPTKSLVTQITFPDQ